MANRKFQDRISLTKGDITVRLALMTFKQDENFVFYSPTLDLYGYGDSEGDALNSFYETIYLYLEYAVEENTLEKDLGKLGWSKHKFFKKQYNTAKYYPKDKMLEKGIKSYGLHNIERPLVLQV